MRNNEISCWRQRHNHKKVRKSSTVVVCNRNDHINEAQKQLGDENVHRKVIYKKKFHFQKIQKRELLWIKL